MSYVRLGDDITTGIEQGAIAGGIADVEAIVGILLPGVGQAVAGTAGLITGKALSTAAGPVLKDVLAPLASSSDAQSSEAQTVISVAQQRLAPVKQAATVSILESQAHTQSLLAQQSAQQQQISGQISTSAQASQQNLVKYALYAAGGILAVVILMRLLRRR